MSRRMLVTLPLVLVLLLAACAPAQPTAEPAAPPAATQPPAPTEPPAAPADTEQPAAEGPCLIVGALYGGPINDAGYNQAMHESVAAIAQNLPCVQIIEAENVPDEAGATATMQNMIDEGAKLIIATAFNMQYPALELAGQYPDVYFEHAGGWEMSGNFANFFGEPPDVFYLLGVAAGMMTESNKLGFVAAFPLGWSLTFANAFELGARSVNPEAETIISYTFNWVDSAKEADTTNALINQGVDVITMHVDAPGTIISTAESRGVYSIGFQSLAAEQFAPEYWITGAGYTLGGTLTFLSSSVMDGSWTPIFLRCSLWDDCMGLAPYGPKVPQEVKDQVEQTSAALESGELVVFQGPILDQDGNVKVAEGETLTADQMSAVDWLVQGIIGSPK